MKNRNTTKKTRNKQTNNPDYFKQNFCVKLKQNDGEFPLLEVTSFKNIVLNVWSKLQSL